MQYRKLGKNNKVSIIGFGCMRLPVVGEDNSKIDEEKAKSQIRYAIDNGINYIDTAYPYHGGNSEAFVGRALSDGYRNKVFVATKSPSWLIKSEEDFDRFLDIQLDRLNTSYIDYYLLHALNSTTWETLKKCNVFDFIKRAISSGKIKHMGFSFHDSSPLFKEIVDSYDWDFCQIQLNYLDENYQAGVDGLHYAASKNIDVIIMEPLRGGRLANNVPDDILKLWNSNKNKHTPAGWALNYLWNKPEVKVVLSGMNSIQQIDDNIAEANSAQANKLSQKEEEIICQVKDLYKSRIKVDCTGCKYCMPCPFGIDIPRNFTLYNDAFVFNDVQALKSVYNNEMTKEQQSVSCQKCGICESKCPQNIKIRDMLDKVTDLLAE